MTTLELAKLVRNSGCEVDISPFGTYNVVCVTVRNKDKVVRYGVDIESVFSDPEKILDYTIEKCVGQVRDFK